MKNYTDEERYELARELEFLSVSIELDAEENIIDQDEADYRMDVLERAIYAVCPDFDKRVTDDFHAAMLDPEIQRQVEESMKSEQAQAFIADIKAYREGVLTLDDMKKKWGR